MVTTINFLYNVHSIETACNFKTVSEEESGHLVIDKYFFFFRIIIRTENTHCKREVIGPFHTPWLTFLSWIVAVGCIISMIGGFVTAFIWMIIGKPFGIHGFIPGIVVGFILIIAVSHFTCRFSDEHIHKIWG